MKIFKNKKGDAGGSTQQVMFVAAELLIGVLIIIFLLYLMTGLAKNSNAQLATTDFIYATKVAAIYPYTAYFSYTGDLSASAIRITEDQIRITIDGGTHTAQYKVPEGITIEPRDFFQPKDIPIIVMNNELSFRKDGFDGIICEKYSKFQAKQKFYIKYAVTTRDEQRLADLLKNGIEQIMNAENINIFEIVNTPREDAETITISFNKNEKTTIKTGTKQGHEAFNCYAKNLIPPEFRTLTEIETETSEEGLEIKFVSTTTINTYITSPFLKNHREITGIKDETMFMQNYAKIIIKEILSKTVYE